MYDRAIRQLEFDTGSTPKQVGPGTYDVDQIKGTHHKTASCAPFLTMSCRDACSKYLLDKDLSAPGPGTYDPADVQPRVLGGTTLTTRERRFKRRVTDTPGPGWYNLKPAREKRADQSHITRSLERAAVGKLITSRIRYNAKTEMASIPTQGVSFGFEEQMDGSLKKLKPPRKDETIGPAFYDQNSVETRATRQYRGVHFGKMGPRWRDLARRSEGPGPGTYDVRGTVDAGGVVCGSGSGDDYRGLMGMGMAPRPVYNIPRYSENLVRESERLDYPGPGKYEIRGQFDPQPPRITPLEGMEMERPPFLSQAKRFIRTVNTVPAPGSYNDPRIALGLLNRLTGLTKSPFGQTALRFKKTTRRKTDPGPGAYNSSGMGAESLRKAYHGSTHKGVFGTTAIRTFTERQDARDLPGPAHYMPKEKLIMSRYEHPSSNFLSVTERMSDPPELIKDVPAPGSYNVAQSYVKSQVHPVVAKPRTLEASRNQQSFVSSTPRFPQRKDPRIPGPGAYEIPQAVSHGKGGLMVNRDKRFKYRVDSQPGPGTYEFAPMVQDTVLKGTFNVTLNNPLAQRCCFLSPSPSVLVAAPSRRADQTPT